MTTQHSQLVDAPEEADLDLASFSGDIAAQLCVIAPTIERSRVMASQLFSRARQSAIAHRSFVTIRREDLSFVTLADGVRAHAVRQDSGVAIVLVQLDAGVVWPWADGVLAHEVLVVQGSLQDADGVELTRYQLGLRNIADLPLRAGDAGAYLYVRQLLNRDALKPEERAWWTSVADEVAPGWLPLSEGVDLKSLRCVGDVVSKLARVAPGAVVGDHGHALDEDCMMLEGDLFLGDILLRQNDYQMAPAGGEHVNSMSDTGALFYFHGCLPG
jgi:hypothetical protein